MVEMALVISLWWLGTCWEYHTLQRLLCHSLQGLMRCPEAVVCLLDLSHVLPSTGVGLPVSAAAFGNLKGSYNWKGPILALGMLTGP